MRSFYHRAPQTPGVYLMKDAAGKILYVGKAANLKRRVSSYFLRPHDRRIQKLVSEVRDIRYRQTPTALEALLLEAELIKKHAPPYNIREKDDKSFLYVVITKEKFPRVRLARGTQNARGERFGPFPSASSLREALRVLRRIFPWSDHPIPAGRPCFNYQIGLCPGTCIGAITRAEYRTHIAHLRMLFRGKSRLLVKQLTREMRAASRALEFEQAAKLRRQLFALRHIADVAFIKEDELRGETPHTRIEGYDISNISGTSAVGSMVVFLDGRPAPSEYRKFKIRTIRGANDVGMLKEVLRRRFRHTPPTAGWPLPHLLLIDGGRGQVHAASEVLREAGLDIPVVGLAKGPTRRKNEVVGVRPREVPLRTLIRVRDEAHRFALSYHKQVRGRRFLDE